MVTLAVSATVFEIFTLKDRKSRNFPTPPFFEAPLEFCNEIWLQKTRTMGLSDGEEIMTLAFFVFGTIPVRDRRMDRHVAIAITRASIASRG